VSSQPFLYRSAGAIRPDQGPIPTKIDMDDPDHRQRWKLVTKCFTPRRIRDQEDALRRTTPTLIGAVAERGECDPLCGTSLLGFH
jgi:cytochrome P450 family 142 subfamily A polypeptide 1